MTAAPFDALLAEARQAHQTHPELDEFCAFPTDLTPQPVTPHPIPAAGLMAADMALKSPDLHPLGRAFLKAGPHAMWRETYKGTDIGEDFLHHFGCYCLIGTGGAYASRQMQSYVVYMPAGLWYPWHQHPAEEMYFVLAGQARFCRHGQADEVLGPGGSVLHRSDQPHALETTDHPILAYVLWRSAFDTPPVLSEEGTA